MFINGEPVAAPIEGTSEREWNNDVMTGSGTFEGVNFSGTTRSRSDKDGALALIRYSCSLLF